MFSLLIVCVPYFTPGTPSSPPCVSDRRFRDLCISISRNLEVIAIKMASKNGNISDLCIRVFLMSYTYKSLWPVDSLLLAEYSLLSFSRFASGFFVSLQNDEIERILGSLECLPADVKRDPGLLSSITSVVLDAVCFRARGGKGGQSWDVGLLEEEMALVAPVLVELANAGPQACVHIAEAVDKYAAKLQYPRGKRCMN